MHIDGQYRSSVFQVCLNYFIKGRLTDHLHNTPNLVELMSSKQVHGGHVWPTATVQSLARGYWLRKRSFSSRKRHWAAARAGEADWTAQMSLETDPWEQERGLVFRFYFFLNFLKKNDEDTIRLTWPRCWRWSTWTRRMLRWLMNE